MGTKLNKNKTNIRNFEFIKELTYDSRTLDETPLDNTYTVFNSYDDILYLVYSNIVSSIILYNLIDYKKINEIKNAHMRNINCLRYYQDKKNKRDIIMSVSGPDCNIKLWNIQNLECIVDIKKINKYSSLFSACFLIDNNQIYIISSHCCIELDYLYSLKENDSIKVFDINGKKIKEMNNSKEKTYFIDSYYDNNLKKHFIITGNNGFSMSFDFDNNEIYHKYSDNDCQNHISIIIKNDEKNVKLIESSLDGNIRIWDFHSAKLLKKIRANKDWIFSICLWDDKYLIVTFYEGILKILDLDNGIFIKKKLETHKCKSLINIKKIFHPEFGECLISQGSNFNQIKLWGCIK